MSLKLPHTLTVLKWLYCVLLGIATGAVSFSVGLTVSNVYGARSALIFDILANRSLFLTRLALFLCFNVTFASAACLVTLLLSSVAAGSGIPEVKVYLNGVFVPKFFTKRTFIAKVVGTACAVSSGLAIGKEGPSVHIGSIIASAIGRSALLRRLQMQNPEAAHPDRDAREFVLCGAAAGLAASFGVPLAGVFFGLELATNRWRAELTWRTLLTCAVSVWSAQLLSSGCQHVDGLCGKFEGIGLFHIVTDFDTPWKQVLPIALLGVLGGLVGALFTQISLGLSKLRAKYRVTCLARFAEVVAVCTTMSSLSFLLLRAGTCVSCDRAQGAECSPASQQIRELNFECEAGSYNDMAVLVFSTHPTVIRSLLLSKFGEFSDATLMIYWAFYFVNAAISYGMTFPSGLFTPSIICGALMGRTYAHWLRNLGMAHPDTGLYSLLGVAAFFGGGLRFTAAIAVMLLEMTQSESQLPFIIMVLLIAKGVADRFNRSIPDGLIKLRRLQFLPDQLPRYSRNLQVADVMDLGGPHLLQRIESAKSIRRALSESPVDRFGVNGHRGPTAALARPSAHLPHSPFVSEEEAAAEAPPPGGTSEVCFLGMVERAFLKDLCRDLPDDTVVDLLDVTRASVALPMTANLARSYEMFLMMTASEGIERMPVIASSGPAIGFLERDNLRYETLKAKHRQQVEQDGLWSLGSLDMPLVVEDMQSGFGRTQTRSYSRLLSRHIGDSDSD